MTTPATPPDPWKSFRGVMSGTLILEAIVVLLALPVVSVGTGGLTWVSGGFLVGMAVLLVLLSGIQGRPRAIWINVGVQLVLVAGSFIQWGIGFIGVVFALVWALLVFLRGEVKRRQEHGLLPGQQPRDGDNPE